MGGASPIGLLAEEDRELRMLKRQARWSDAGNFQTAKLTYRRSRWPWLGTIKGVAADA